MKKCRRCTKPATMHITEIREGQAQSLHLCETCAQEYLNSVEVGGSSEEFQAESDRNEAVRLATSKYMAVTEAAIRKQPSAWLWAHDRWRTRPPAETY